MSNIRIARKQTMETYRAYVPKKRPILGSLPAYCITGVMTKALEKAEHIFMQYSTTNFTYRS